MKKLILLLVATFTTVLASAQYTFEPPYIPSQNNEPVRSEFITYRTAADARENNPSKSENRSLLDGEWSLRRIDGTPDQALVAREADLSGWTKAQIPSSDNFFPPKEGGSTLLLARDFVVPFDYTDRALYLHIGATSDRATVYVNGHEVGYTTDPKVPAEYKISDYVERGLNRVVVSVDQFSEATAIAEGSTRNEGGIVRSVYLFAQPKIRIFDITAKSSLDPTFKNGLLEIALLVKSELLNPHDVTIYYDLYDSKGRLVNQEHKPLRIDMRRQDTVRFTSTIMNVNKWDFETPELYTAMFSIKREGRFTEYVARRVGFRSIESVDKRVLINGQPTVFRGVNLYMINSLHSDFVSSDTIIKNLITLREQGVNAIRTPYPLQNKFYDACDSVGMYVISNANLNTRNMYRPLSKGGAVSNDPAWRDIFVERVVSSYEYLKLHPSVVAFGLGEDAGNGYNMYQAYLEIRRRNSDAVIVYDEANMEWNTDWYMPTSSEKQYGVEVQPLVYSRSEDPQLWKTLNGGFLGEYKSDKIYVENLSQIVDGDYSYVTIEEVDTKKGVFKITNNLPSLNLSYYGLDYKIYNNSGKVVD
ncbi:MAG: glycoside hydrolase family 2 TIM barrel-domain containing protein, partial [Rikenellaceae bacterium]